jgi:EAL domain-containing protein (putative c-di-GMP-specific phosphodiesterase class I)
VTSPASITTGGDGPAQKSVLDRRLLDDRERFVTFAFAGADLLVEATAEGRITFAAGAFRSRLGLEPATLIGKRAATMVAPEDRAAFSTCLALLGSRGRVAPTVLRLADAGRTSYVLSGLARRGPDGVGLFCLSFGPPASAVTATGPQLRPAADFGREVEGRLRAVRGDLGVASPALDLLELVGSGPELPAADVAALLLDRVGAGGVAGELAPGRFALLRADDAGTGAPDLADLVAGLQRALSASGVTARIAGAERLDLAGKTEEPPTTLQAVRALRCALSAFARGGAPALAAAGFHGGLGGFVTAATSHTAALRSAVAERRFRLAFQPIVRLSDRALHHYEALLRPEPIQDLAVHHAADLVAMTEMLGLAAELDWTVFLAARAAAARSNVAVAFNLSGLSVQNPEFRTRLLAMLDRPTPGLAAHLLVELTETAEIEDEEAAAATLRALRDRGVAVCIDDFGCGAAAFRYLRRFQVDHVKIDGSYVRNAAEDERDRSFVAAMVDLSRSVGADAIAEQIETEAVASVMLKIGVRYGQGWLFGAPSDLPAVTATAPRRRGVTKEVWE